MGCTTSFGRSPFSRNQLTLDVDRAAGLSFRVFDRTQRAVAELDKNGVSWREPIDDTSGQLGQGSPSPGRQQPTLPPALNVANQGCEDFVSDPNAAETSPADIANVESLSAIEAREVLAGVANRLGIVVVESDPLAPEPTWGDGWPEDDERWTLTPHQLRRLRPAKAARSR